MKKKAFGAKICVLIWLVVCSTAGYAKSRAYFDIKSLQCSEKKSFAFIKIKYKCNIKLAENAELKVYALLKKGRQETVTLETFKLSNVEKGSHEKQFMITASDTKTYGKARKLRVEIWYKDRLTARKTKPRPKEEWWKEEPVTGIIVRADKEIIKLLKKDDDD